MWYIVSVVETKETSSTSWLIVGLECYKIKSTSGLFIYICQDQSQLYWVTDMCWGFPMAQSHYLSNVGQPCLWSEMLQLSTNGKCDMGDLPSIILIINSVGSHISPVYHQLTSIFVYFQSEWHLNKFCNKMCDVKIRSFLKEKWVKMFRDRKSVV